MTYLLNQNGGIGKGNGQKQGRELILEEKKAQGIDTY